MLCLCCFQYVDVFYVHSLYLYCFCVSLFYLFSCFPFLLSFPFFVSFIVVIYSFRFYFSSCSFVVSMLYFLFLIIIKSLLLSFKFSVLFCFVFISKARLCLMCFSFDMCLFSCSLFFCVFCDCFSLLFLVRFIQFGHVVLFKIYHVLLLFYSFLDIMCFFHLLLYFFWILENIFTHWIDKLQIQFKKYIEWKSKTTIEKIDTYYIFYHKHTHTHVNIHKNTHAHRKQKWTVKCAFCGSFSCPTRTKPTFHHWFPQNGAWTALKPPQMSWNTERNLHFTPGFSQKGAWTALKPPPTKKKKSRNKSAPLS